MKHTVNRVKPVKTGKLYEPEERIAMLVKRGAIASAGRNAIAASFKRGLSVTVLEDGVIYRLHPDGSRTAIKSRPMFTSQYPTGKMTIK